VATIPDEPAVRSWLKISDATMSVEELEAVRMGELELQFKTCRLYPGVVLNVADMDDLEDLYPYVWGLALLRRCGRTVAARGVPLGVVGSDEYGPSRLPAFDAEIERYERPYRRFAFG
jgi:hypothetical protein